MAEGHAESAPGTDGLADLASFIVDNPELESEDEEDGTTADTDPDEDTSEEADDQPDSDEDKEPSEDDKTDPAPDRKIKVSLKGDDGIETETEVSESELIKGYHRQSDYTKKMQSLSEREGQAVQFLKSKHDEIRNQYTEQAEFYKTAVTQMAGLRSESEMAQLAQHDPAAWVAENQRQQSVRTFLSNLDNSIKGERSQAQQEAERTRNESIKGMTERAWSELSKEKIDRPALTKIYGDTSKTYGFSPEELGNVYDPRLVKMMRDATAYQALKAKAPEVTRKAEAAPRMPSSKQATPAQERQKQQLNDRFKGGRGKLNDLAALLR